VRKPGDPVVWTDYVYDWSGRTLEVRHAPVTGNGAAGSQGKTVYVYNVEGAPLRSTVQVTDPAGRWKKQWTDGFGQLVRVTEPKPGGGEYVSDYTYTALGKLKTVTMARDGYKNSVPAQYTQTRTFVYDGYGSLTQTIFPESGTATYTYANGRMETQTDALGRMRKWVYESGRLTRIERYYAGVERTAERTEITYDAYGRTRTAAYGSDRGRITETYDYFASGQLQAKTMSGWIGQLKAEFSYDAEGRPYSVKYPKGDTLYLKYNEADRPKELWKTMPAPSLDELQASAGYDWRGLMTSMTRPDGWQQTWGYNDGGLMTSHMVAPSWNNITNVSYTYESLAPVTGKLQSMTQNGNTVSYVV
jgi:YD repeat-containing protein